MLFVGTKNQDIETLLSTVKHEILHALGFSVSLYAFFRDENGNPRTPRKPDTGKPYLNEKLQIHQWSNTTIRKIIRDNWQVKGGNIKKEINVMVTPRVVQEIRNHFNCSELEGAELEDQGGEGTAWTHWEKRILENEAMTGESDKTNLKYYYKFNMCNSYRNTYTIACIFSNNIGTAGRQWMVQAKL